MASPQQTPGSAIHEASRLFDGSGLVEFGPELTFDEAVARRNSGLDIVVRGGSLAENRKLAKSIETKVGHWTLHMPHLATAGRHALPHLQQSSGTPGGHNFYETENRKAKQK